VWGERPEVVAPVGPEYPTADLADRLDLSRCRPLDGALRDWGLYEEGGVEAACPHVAPMPTRLQIAFARTLRRREAKLVSVDVDDHELGPIEPATALSVTLPQTTRVAPELLQMIPYVVTVRALVLVGWRSTRSRNKYRAWRFDPLK
jgi:hypothetical protein